MPDRMLAAVVESLLEIAETMLFVEITPGASGYEKCTLGADVSAVIGYSAALKGSLRLAGPTSAALKLAGALMGEEREVMDKEMEDAYAEMGNMIAGGVQTRLEGEIGAIRMSPPVVISGKNHQVSGDRSFACISHQFELDSEPFFVEIYFAKDALGGEMPTSGSKTELVAEVGSSEQKYGFSLSLPFTAGFDDAAGETGEAEEEIHDSGASASEKEEHVASAVKELFGLRLEELAREAARDMVRKMLPEVAERMVREEIERIKRGEGG